jgi:thiamine kinase-like enzyme
MSSRTLEEVDLIEQLVHPLEEWREPGARELCECLREMLDATVQPNQPIQLQRLKRAVYRLRLGDGTALRLVIKRHKPQIAQTDRLLAERWLPALGLGDRCPRLLGTVAERAGSSVWHIYEDLGDDNLVAERLPWRLGAAVDFLAELHTRAAAHPLLPEVRWRARDHGAHFFVSSLRDAITAVEATLRLEQPRELAAARARLLHRLDELLEDAPRRVRLMEDVAGSSTLLHGDLWPKNVFVTMSGDGPQARLIDWDHVGVGSFSYDISTFVYQSSAEERPWIVQRYRDAVQRAGWRLPGNRDLGLLFHTAESARYAHCVLWAAMAVIESSAEWAIRELIDYDRWFEALHPPLTE